MRCGSSYTHPLRPITLSAHAHRQCQSTSATSTTKPRTHDGSATQCNHTHGCKTVLRSILLSLISHPRPRMPTHTYALCLDKLHAVWQLVYAHSAPHHISARTSPMPKHIRHVRHKATHTRWLSNAMRSHAWLQKVLRSILLSLISNPLPRLTTPTTMPSAYTSYKRCGS